jgi:hypothetical protein
MRDSLTSYLFPSQTASTSTSTTTPMNTNTNTTTMNNTTYPLTPPQSVSLDRHMPQPMISRPPHHPLTPVSSSSPDSDISTGSYLANTTSIPLISTLFPFHASQMTSRSHLLEIVTPPDHVLEGFILDQPHSGRTVFVHLPPPHSSSHRPEILQPHFSEVLRPHDPLHHRQILMSSPPGQAKSLALDIKESLTALLDLSSDSLEAKNLILVLDRDDRDQERLEDLLHSLMYAGGQVLAPGRLEGGYEWDIRHWVLVGIEL